MTNSHWLTVLGVVPLVGAAVVTAMPKARAVLAKQVALGFSLVTLVLTVVMCAEYKTSNPGFQFTEAYSWIPEFGIRYSLGVDGISLVLIALTAILVPLVLLASWDTTEPNPGGFAALVLVLETLLVGVFAATDVFLFYVFFEAMLIPMYFLIGSYGGTQRSYAAVKFLLYSLFGGLLMLASVIGLYVLSAQQLTAGTFDFTTLAHLVHFTPATEKALFLGFFIAFAIKAPLWPFHTWLPDAGAEAPTGGAVLLVGVLDKVGTFGFLRYGLELFPHASRYFAPLVITLGVIGVLYGALVAMAQRDLKRLVSYTSVAHFGFIALGCFALTSQSMVGAVLYMVNHGLSTGALFFVVGFLTQRRKTRMMGEFGGIAQVAPLMGGAFLIAGLSSLALPGMNSFVSEFLVLVGSFGKYTVATILATTGIILAALYVLVAYQRTMQGPLTEANRGVRDLNGREIAVLAPLVVLILALGIYPKPVTDVIRPAVERTMHAVNVNDPTPKLASGAHQ